MHRHPRDAQHDLLAGRVDRHLKADGRREGEGAGGIHQDGPQPVAGAHGPLHDQVAFGDEDPGEVAAGRLPPPTELVVAQAEELLDPGVVRIGDRGRVVEHAQLPMVIWRSVPSGSIRVTVGVMKLER